MWEVCSQLQSFYLDGLALACYFFLFHQGRLSAEQVSRDSGLAADYEWNVLPRVKAVWKLALAASTVHTLYFSDGLVSIQLAVSGCVWLGFTCTFVLIRAIALSCMNDNSYRGTFQYSFFKFKVYSYTYTHIVTLPNDVAGISVEVADMKLAG
jgi:hypothetical protein